MPRPKGSLNKSTKEVKQIAQKYTNHAIKELARIAKNANSEQARVSACRELLDRGHGKAPQALVGDKDLPLTLQITTGVPRDDD
jgi:hypothetical protein